MALDPYSLCLCGSGKKLKFCCADLQHELEQIESMLQGDQQRACLDYLGQQLEKHPGRTALLVPQAMLLREMGQLDQAAEALEQALAQQPNNAAALTQWALICLLREGAQASVEPLAKALANCGEQMSRDLYEAIGLVAERLLVEGYVHAARGHLLLQVRIAPDDSMPRDLLVRMHVAPSLPLILKEEPRFSAPPEGAVWEVDYNQAVGKSLGLDWLGGEQILKRLTQVHPGEPALWRALANVQLWLADTPGALASLRQLAALDVPLEDAVEAEALAQLLDPLVSGDEIEELLRVYHLKDFDTVAASFAAHRRTVALPVQQLGLDPAAGPLPRQAYWLLDREMPASGATLSVDEAPNILGRAMLFGRETDREPRVELQLYRDHLAPIAEVESLLREVAGGDLSEMQSDRITGQVPRTDLLLSWNWRLPDDTPPALVRTLLDAKRRQMVLEVWPAAPLPVLDGKSVAEAATVPALRIKALAAMLLTELAVETTSTFGLVNELRAKLGLPTRPVIDPTQTDVETLPLVRLAYLDAEKMTDAQLERTQRRAMANGARIAIERLTRVVLARPELASRERAASFGLLASLCEDEEESLSLLKEAQQAASSAGESPARWYLEELMLRLERGEGTEASRVLEYLQRHHGNEPSVRAALYQLLTSAGMVGPDGRPQLPTQGAASEGLILPGAAEPGKLWTPDGDSGGSKKSALWTPD